MEFQLTFVGNIIYSACQWGHAGGGEGWQSEMVGNTVAMAIATPILPYRVCNSAVLTTDVRERVPFGEYLGSGYHYVLSLLSSERFRCDALPPGIDAGGSDHWFGQALRR